MGRLAKLPQLLSQQAWLRPPMRFVHRQLVARRPWMRTHPFDTQNGVDTSGYVPWWLLGQVGRTDAQNKGYAGCQPSCVRAALAGLPALERFAYVDLGCGKGRSLVIASEHPFREIVGVEIAAELCRTARANAAVVAARHPDRTPIEIREGDATTAPLPNGDLLIFIYHSFGEGLLQRIVDRLTSDPAGRSIAVIYENPVHGQILDAAPGFRRWQAQDVPCQPDELGFAPETSEVFVTWVHGLDAPMPAGDAHAEIGGTPWRAELRQVADRV